MILTVTLNAALDITYAVPALVPHASHLVERSHARAGGKGINVARVLHAGGEPVRATGLLGGRTGDRIRDDLDASAIPHRFVTINAESRCTVAVVAADTGDATIFNEAGPTVTGAEWISFLSLYEGLLAEAEIVVCSGSLPRGISTDAYADLIRRASHLPVIVDCEGPQLLAAASAGAAVLKPNQAELRATTGRDDPTAGATALLDRGARAVVVSLGADGMLAFTREGAWRAHAGHRLRGNPTGAGDACVAALAAGIHHSATWPETLRQAVAWSAGAVVAPHAGDVDAVTAARMFDTTHIQEIHATHTDR